MSTLLFSNIPSRDEDVLKSAKFSKIAIPVMCILMIVLCISAFYEEQYDAETAILFLLYPVLFILLLGLSFVAAVRIKWQRLLVYDDKILLRQVWSTKERKIDLTPSDYKIKVKKYIHRGGATVHLIFVDKNNRCLFRYVTNYTTHLEKWLKYQLLKIGCEIIHPKNGY